ncbi:hypothetical protein FCG41_04415 [Azotobacter chroococcum]|nr:hypothetical protein FCG41_04415 [Azotobacter chroococcum]
MNPFLRPHDVFGLLHCSNDIPKISKNRRERHQLRRPKMLLKSSSNPATTRPEPSRRFCMAPMMDWTYFY